MDFKCRDCGEIHDVSKKADRRLSICNFCFEIRGRVLQAVKANEMPIADFQKYQKNGMRSKRLVGMGYGHLVMPSPQADYKCDCHYCRSLSNPPNQKMPKEKKPPYWCSDTGEPTFSPNCEPFDKAKCGQHKLISEDKK